MQTRLKTKYGVINISPLIKISRDKSGRKVPHNLSPEDLERYILTPIIDVKKKVDWVAARIPEDLEIRSNQEALRLLINENAKMFAKHGIKLEWRGRKIED